MLSVINYLLGNVHVEVRGAYPERFLNLCAQNKIAFWDMTRPEIDVLRIRVSVADYLSLRKYAKKTMCHLHILKKTGLPFFTNKFRKRFALITGLAVFCITVWVLSSFIWVINIEGYSNVDPAFIREHLKNNGVYIGAYGKSINMSDLQNDILLNIPELSFITVNLSGSHANVTVRERTKPPKIISMDEESNIVASRGGIITSITVQSGMPEVKPGDTVVEGQLLAGGYMTGRAGTTITCRAIAEVKARTWQNFTAKYPLKTRVKTYTGNKSVRHTIIFGDRRIKLYFNSGNPYIECDKIGKSAYLTLPGNIKLPIALETQMFREYKTKAYDIPVDTVYEYISDRMEQYIQLDDRDVLLNKRFEGKIINGAAAVNMIAECEQIIGKEQIIPKGK